MTRLDVVPYSYTAVLVLQDVLTFQKHTPITEESVLVPVMKKQAKR